jgi:hypothetical protein
VCRLRGNYSIPILKVKGTAVNAYQMPCHFESNIFLLNTNIAGITHIKNKVKLGYIPRDKNEIIALQKLFQPLF